MKRRILERFNNNVDEKGAAANKLENGKAQPYKSAAVNQQSTLNNEDRASIITQDRLRKFNEIYGYENGPATNDLD